MGELPNEKKISVAIVGSRKPTKYGREATEYFARELAKRGVVIVSGLALGVDAIAHRAALDAGGETIAVLANSLPNIRPMTNKKLGERILENGGAIISENKTDEKFGPWEYLNRNRLVSGLADAVLITEAAGKSGTLNTAAHALSQGKDVFVVPGNITSPMSVGCNNLLKQGAMPATHINDLIQALGLEESTEKKIPKGSNELEDKIIKLIADGVNDGEEIQRKLKISTSELNVALTMLEINGIISPLGGNKWSLK